MRTQKPAEKTQKGKRADRAFFERSDVTLLARDLLGKFLVSHVGGEACSGMITETEAYAGQSDRACHAYGGRRTKRTEVMYWKGGTAYVYLCYGIHHLFNVISGPQEAPDAVLIRAIEAEEGQNTLLRRRKMERPSRNWLGGPGKLTHGLGIRNDRHNGRDLTQDDELWIEDRGIEVPDELVRTSSRIGIDHAGPDAALPYRYYLNEGAARELLRTQTRNELL